MLQQQLSTKSCIITSVMVIIIIQVSLNSLHIDWQVCGFMGGMENSLVQPDADINQRELQRY